VYKLARDFNLDISLFERMLKNRMHCEVLKVQHRMRPEGAELIVPSIYPELINDSSVLHYKTIRGMLKSVFFITHNHPEEEVCNAVQLTMCSEMSLNVYQITGMLVSECLTFCQLYSENLISLIRGP
jgi:hypothetical protein